MKLSLEFTEFIFSKSTTKSPKGSVSFFKLMTLATVVGISLVVIFASLFVVFQYSISEAPPKPIKPNYTEFSLNEQLDQSQEKIDSIKDNYFDGRYNGNLSLDQVIKILEDEVKLQKRLYDKYQNLPHDMKTSLEIADKFGSMKKHWFATEESIINSIRSQISSELP